MSKPSLQGADGTDRRRALLSPMAKTNFYRFALLVFLILMWYALTKTEILPPFFFGEPVEVFWQVYDWVVSGEIYGHLWITLLETILAFVAGTVLGVVFGIWLGLSSTASALLDPYLKAVNAMPRVVFAPIFAVWFGLGIWSKVALGVTLVFFVIFFNVYHGVREVNPTTLANARMLGASKNQLLRFVYIPSAMSWVFASMHNAVGMAFVGAVVGEYFGSARGVGYLIQQAEGVFDINGVFAGLLVLTLFAICLDSAVTLAERRLLAWQPK